MTSPEPLAATLAAAERDAILSALLVTAGNRTAAATRLGISHRHICRRIVALGLDHALVDLARKHRWADAPTPSGRALRSRTRR